MTTKKKTNRIARTVRLKDVRLSFPALWRARERENDKGEITKKFEAAFLIDRENDKNGNIRAIETAVDEILDEAGFDREDLGKDRLPLQRGDRKEYDGYGPGISFISAKNSRRPQVVDRDLSPLTEDDEKPYAGCYVNATITLVWYENKKKNHVSRIIASLEAVQYLRKGDGFGASSVDVNEEFQDLGDEDGDDESTRRRSRDKDEDDRSSSRRKHKRNNDDDEDDDRGSRRSSRSSRRDEDEDDRDLV